MSNVIPLPNATINWDNVLWIEHDAVVDGLHFIRVAYAETNRIYKHGSPEADAILSWLADQRGEARGNAKYATLPLALER